MNAPATVSVDTPLGGRAQLECNLSHRLFGRLATTPIGATTLLPFVDHPMWTQASNGCRRLFRITAGAIEIQRNAAAPVTPLDSSAFYQAAPPAGAFLTRRSQVRLVLELGDGSIFARRIELDFGQSIDFMADCFALRWRAPADFFDLNFEVATPLDGLVLDVLAGVGIWEIEESTSANTITFSQAVSIPKTTAAVVPVPDGAERVQVSIAPTGAAGNWLFTYATFLTVGTLAVGAGRESAIELVGAGASHIVSDTDADNDRIALVRWELRP